MTDFQKELIRKSTHTAGLFFLPILFWKPLYFSALFLCFLIIYLGVEVASRKNLSVPLLTWITKTSKRDDEKNQFAWGAILLSTSCIILPLLFPERAVALGLGQTFVADAIAALAGMCWGKTKIPFSNNKSWAGSASYLCSAFLISLVWTQPQHALFLALMGCFLEMISKKNVDNIAIPFGVSGLAWFLMS